MLLKLFANNFGAFRDGFELHLEADPLSTDEGYGYFSVEVDSQPTPIRVLRLIGIYGANASGKTTIIKAARSLYDLIVNSGPQRQEGDSIKAYFPFKLDEKMPQAPCELGCEVIVGNKIFEYRVSFTSKYIVQERITEYGSGKGRIWLDRTSPTDIHVENAILPEATTVHLEDVTRENASALSVAAMLKQKAFINIFTELKRSLRAVFTDGLGASTIQYSVDKLYSDEDFRNWAIKKLISPADLGITNAIVEQRDFPKELVDTLPDFVDKSKFPTDESIIEVSFFHRGITRDYLLDIASESSGTKKLLALSGPWYDIIHNDITAFIDEISSSLHPALLKNLLIAINEAPASNRSQLVFNLHDLTPMEKRILRRDQIYFTEKDRYGVAKLFSLSDFDERAENNFRKRYLEGRYGAMPDISLQYTLFDSISRHEAYE